MNGKRLPHPLQDSVDRMQKRIDKAQRIIAATDDRRTEDAEKARIARLEASIRGVWEAFK